MDTNTSTAYDHYSAATLHRLNSTELSAKQFKRWQDCIETRCGLFFDKSRMTFLCNSLLDRIGKLDLSGYDEYLKFLLYGNDAEREWKELYCTLVNCETSFFRHEPSFDVLKDRVFPELLKNKKNDFYKLLSIWSVGCSSGQEAYSLALSAVGSYDTDEFYTKIIGSDINLHLLKKARKGVYTPSDVKSLNPNLVDRYLFPYSTNGSTFYKFRDEVKDLVSFNFINLVEPITYQVFSVDIIFCQNVLFYFSKRRRVEILNRLGEHLVKGGYLVLGSSDVLPEEVCGMSPIYTHNSIVYKKM